MTEPRYSLRTRLASGLTKSAAALSRATGRGDGAVIGGRVGQMIDPEFLANLAAGRRIALISGTNGKTTTTRLTAAALGVLGNVATNSLGANMPHGHMSALVKAGATPFAVLEVDEHYLADVLKKTKAELVALLNLSRDQLDRAQEVATVAAKWRTMLTGAPEVHVIANCDDPMVTWAASAATQVTWVAAGQRWLDDSWVCPECGSRIERHGEQWFCVNGDLTRPMPQWQVEGDGVVDPTGVFHEVHLQLPGRVNKANAATALAVAAYFGAPTLRSLPKLAEVTSIAGRYATVVRDDRVIRLLLSKNPAGWLEAFDMAEDAPTLLAINARDPDGLDTSWLYDVDFSPVRGRRVLITGDRAMDLAVRLEVNEVPFEHVTSFEKALAAIPPGRLEVIANYTAFQDIRAELDRVN
ncbi:Mur ligase family protein [Virgisporangium aurantiacum]|uniref:Lipid II isoglutaminyl synthase (glutamine-hydrolyzing) subunit MurT n=1 Tax=Virgisporangium aurantiacum TaxID=175570 RepID=A0A8J3ZCC0_9ACTN|nr:Mur ligase family protein [Virgisporangium aurantiacum]GIJ61594.1 ligase [Virgisporangium aurantiacum]